MIIKAVQAVKYDHHLCVLLAGDTFPQWAVQSVQWFPVFRDALTPQLRLLTYAAKATVFSHIWVKTIQMQYDKSSIHHPAASIIQQSTKCG